MTWLIYLFLSLIGLALSLFIVNILESSMITHMLILYPVIIYLGFYFGCVLLKHYPNVTNSWNKSGIAGVLIASFALIFWMIPRWIDASLNHLLIDVLKYGSLFLFVGVSLGISWKKLGPIAKAVIKIEFITMLYRLGWIYMISPDRLCNNYFLSEQKILGEALIVLAILCSILWLFPLFINKKSSAYKSMKTN